MKYGHELNDINLEIHTFSEQSILFSTFTKQKLTMLPP